MAEEKLEVVITAKDETGGMFTKLGGVLKGGLFAAAGVAVTGLTAVGGGLAYSIQQAMSAQEVQAQLQAVLESTGGTAGVTADMANRLATEYGNLTRFEDDAVLAGENMLLTFTNIGGEIFPWATSAMLDMSQALGQDLKSSAIQLGKALNDPIGGVTALRRVGVAFDEDTQGLIETLVEEGDIMSAQEIILQELQKEFGGSAEAAGQTFAGQLERLQNTFGNVAETVGTAFLPTLQQLGERLINFVQGDQFQGWVETISNWLMNELPVAIQKASDFWTNELKPSIDEFWPILRDDLLPALGEVVKFLGTLLPPIIKAFVEGWRIQIQVIEFFLAPFKRAIDGFGVLKTQIEEVIGPLDEIKNRFTEFFERIKNIDWAELGRSIIQGIISGLTTSVANLLSTASDIATDVVNTMKSILGISSPSKVMEEQIGKQMGLGIQQGLMTSLDALQTSLAPQLTTTIMPIANALAPALATTSANGSVGVPAAAGRNITIQISAGTILSFTDEAGLERVLKPLVEKWMGVT